MEETEEIKKAFRSDEELKQLAVDIVDGKVWTDRHGADSFLIAKLAGLPAGTWMIYEYLTQAGPLAVNGCPTFLSCRIVWKEESEKLIKYFDEYKALKDSFKKSTE